MSRRKSASRRQDDPGSPRMPGATPGGRSSVKGVFARFERYGGQIVARIRVPMGESEGMGLATLFDPPDDLVAGEELTLDRDADRKLVLRERRL